MIAAESGHWYTETGAPCYEVPNKSKPGQMRQVTLTDARKLNLFPSVTTILKMAAKPGLEIWKQKQMLLAALTLPKIEGETLDQFAERVVKDAAHEAEVKRDIGKQIHAEIEKAIENAVSGQDYDPKYRQHVYGSMLAIDQFGKFHSEKSFSHRLGYGGKVDLHNDNVLIDIKTTEFGKDDLKTLFDEHKMQLSAYAHGLGLHCRKFILFVSTSEPGLVRLVEHTEHDKALKMFLCLLSYYQAKNNYYPEMKNGH